MISARRPRLLVINASLAGDAGNTAWLLGQARRHLGRKARVEGLTLADEAGFEKQSAALATADGFLIGTGTHWDSWSSVLQKFLEAATPAEGTPLWLGKPAAVLVTEHSVGGKGVLSRLQGVLVTLGCQIPPLSGLVVSRAALLAARAAPDATQDFWGKDDLRIACHNLVEAAAGTRRWKAWTVERENLTARWVETD